MLRCHLLALVLASEAAAASVGINELLPDPVGPDAGAKDVELFNATAREREISGWTLEVGGPGRTPVFTFPANSWIASDTHIVLAKPSAGMLGEGRMRPSWNANLLDAQAPPVVLN